MENIRISIENLSNDNGLFLTPFWIGLHDGTFDTYNRGEAVTEGLERLAEDGNTSVLSEEFVADQENGQEAIIAGAGGVAGVIDPGEQTNSIITIENIAANAYLSYAAMIIPSNDAFVANGDPMAIQLFDGEGRFQGANSFIIAGSDVLDAGTEVNTENDAAFINQTAPNSGEDENGVVATHPGFIGSQGNPEGEAIILGGTNAAGQFIDPNAADFTQEGYQIVSFHINRPIA